jgi:hypothetical protein
LQIEHFERSSQKTIAELEEKYINEQKRAISQHNESLDNETRVLEGEYEQELKRFKEELGELVR